MLWAGNVNQEKAKRVFEPYYQDRLVTIYHNDCQNILPHLGRFDLLMTDIPFGQRGNFKEVMEAIQMVKYTCAAILTDWRNSITLSDLRGKVGELIWEYGWISGGRTRAKYGVLPTHNTIHLFGDITKMHFIEGTIIKRGPGLSSPRQCSYARKSGHPYEKPTELFTLLLKGIEAGTVVDPFAGSGITGVACKQAEIQCVLIEKEERYCDMIIEKLQHCDC